MGDLVPLRREDGTDVAQVGTPPLAQARAHLVKTTDDCMELLRWLSSKTKIGFDTETTGLDHDRDRARLVQIGDQMDGWAIPFERWAGLVDDVVARYEGTYVMHNAPFDWAMMQNGGVDIPIGRIHDTRLKAHVITSTGSLALKTLAQRHVDPHAHAAQQALEEAIGRNGAWTWANVPVTLRDYWVYGALDPILTIRLDDYLDPIVQADAPLSYELEMRATWVCERMARKGVAVNRPYTEELYTKFTQHVKVIEEYCTEHYGVKPGSNDAVVEILQRDGRVLSKLTDTGRYSLDKDVLAEFSDRSLPQYHPLADAVFSRRRAQKVASTYLRHYLDGSAWDGRIHPSINSIGGSAKNPFESGGMRGVRTGRMSMDDPNMQNVPIHTVMAKTIRNCFEAMCDRRCGCGQPHRWLKFDFDQIEMRVFGHLAEDLALIEMFKQAIATGLDPFTAACREIFRDPRLGKDDIRRQHTKNAFYAIIYGAGLDKFAMTAGIRDAAGRLDLAVANAFLTRLHQMYPGIKQLQRAIEQEAFTRLNVEGDAYVRSPLTNRRHTADRGREYAIMNYLVQGTAAEILKMKMIECDAAGLGPFMTLPVHDEIDFDVPEAQAYDVLQTAREIMNDPTLLSVPITATASLGQRWGAVEDVV